MASPSTAPGPRTWWLLALGTSLAVALWTTFPAWLHPATSLPCHVVHPDCGGNQWLLAWVADRVLHGQGLLHNDRYYWPAGDAPFLAGNGGEGLLYAPLHALLGWPVAANVHLVLLVLANGLAGAWAARGAGASWPGALLAAAAMGASPYAVRELTAGRAAQADLAWCLGFLGAFLRLLEAPSARRAVLAGAFLAIASILYWYHGVFLALAAAVLALGTLPGRVRAARASGPQVALATALPWRALAVLTATAAVLAAGPLAWYLAHWSLLPGTGETGAFPHPEAVADGLWPAVPFLVSKGRGLGQALSAVVVLLAPVAVARAFLRRSDRPWLDLSLAVLWAVFLLLALGPSFRVAGISPFEVVYGIAAPLRRFWWPSRHVAIAGIALVLLAARAVPAPRRPAAAVALALALAALVPASLALQGTPARVAITRMDPWPPPFYERLARAPGTLALELPLSPEVAMSQKHLLFQMVHGKSLVTGHAAWVDRVRPPAWDAFVAANSFLSGIRRIEEGDPATELTFREADLAALRAAGLGPVILNGENFPLVRYGAVRRLHRVLIHLFGKPREHMKRAWAWDAQAWTGATTVPVLPLEPGRAQDPGLADGDSPIALRTPSSEIFTHPREGFDAPPAQDGGAAGTQ